MNEEFNHDLCTERHRVIDVRLEKGEQKMDTIWRIIRSGNGWPSHETRIDRIEQLMARNNSLLWRILTPALPLIYGALFALGVAWVRGL